MPARLSVIVPLSGLAKVRRAKVPLPLVSALQDDPEYSAELPEDRTSHGASRAEARASCGWPQSEKRRAVRRWSALILVLGGRYDAGNE